MSGRWTRLLGALTMAITLSPFLPAATAAEATWHADADDSSSRLDIRRAGLLERKGNLVSITIRTFERINLARHGQLWALLDSRGGPRWDYGFHIHYDGGSDGIFCDWRDRQGQVNPVIGWWVRDRAASCRFDAGRIAVNKPVRWRVFSTGVTPSRSLPKPRPSDMLDRAPDGGSWWFSGVALLLDP